MRFWLVGVALVLPVWGVSVAQAQSAGVVVTPTVAPAAASPVGNVPAPLPSSALAATVAPSAPAIPALTPVSLEIGADLGSKTSKSGDTFPIRLHEAIVIDGKELVPAGASGMGEVVDAMHARFGGAAGRLVLAADYLTVSGRSLRLRSLRLGGHGTSHVGETNAAALVVTPLLGLLISGGEIVVPKGALAEAKTSAEFILSDIPEAIAAPRDASQVNAPQHPVVSPPKYGIPFSANNSSGPSAVSAAITK